MKVLLCCAVFVGVLALARAEGCTSDSGCTHVTCPENDYQVDCHLGTCTCTHLTATCTSQSQCQDSDCHRTMHCVDGKCRCGYGGFLPGIGK